MSNRPSRYFPREKEQRTANPPAIQLLPPDAIAALQKAAATEPSAADPMRRQKAIEKTTQHLKTQYPQFFQGARPCQ
jgi:hypothetical protein